MFNLSIAIASFKLFMPEGADRLPDLPARQVVIADPFKPVPQSVAESKCICSIPY
ncbi:hypothetical protein [Coleofasciculus sp. FACHB-1120]|uniref:hypothetical protein n=1 Tax=Coleofasciculus sp. FACHB-1120 TaxID=2692783 RepID=UPI001689F787|nr:hypothetical protein [Coleofasciculus sp. FACHB-1120]MBD2741669.1 hypothetical protein [Coleofasciculus sp. FACHB-1120]